MNLECKRKLPTLQEIKAMYPIDEQLASQKKATDDALEARELIKLKVLLETAPEKPYDIADKLAAATHAEVVSVVGGSMVFYRYNKKLHEKKKK